MARQYFALIGYYFKIDIFNILTSQKRDMTELKFVCPNIILSPEACVMILVLLFCTCTKVTKKSGSIIVKSANVSGSQTKMLLLLSCKSKNLPFATLKCCCHESFLFFFFQSCIFVQNGKSPNVTVVRLIGV